MKTKKSVKATIKNKRIKKAQRLNGKKPTDQVFDIAIVGVTGAVGETMLEILAERQFPVGKIYALASERSVGKQVKFGNKMLPVEDLADFDFSKAQIALFSPGAKVSAIFAPKAAAAGCVVIDNTSQFRYDDEVPLVVPEVNPDDIAMFTKRGIIANPNCSTIQMVVALKPIYDAAGITRVNVATYQSVSGAGRKGITELAEQTAYLLNGQPIKEQVFVKQIAFNVLPQIGDFQENGYTHEEMKMIWETQKIFNDKRIKVNPTTVRVPVFYGHSEAIHIETREKITCKRAKDLFRRPPGVILLDDKNDFPTAVTDAATQDAVYVGRLREDISHPRGLDLWVVADNVRKGAALNAIQIAELLAANYL